MFHRCCVPYNRRRRMGDWSGRPVETHEENER